MAGKVRAALNDRESCRRLADAARAQAYEVFGLSRCVAHHARLWSNLLAGRPAGHNIADTAVAR